MTKPPRLLYVVNIPRFFVSHRLALARAAQAAGYEVHVATAGEDAANLARIRDAGLELRSRSSSTVVVPSQSSARWPR